MSTKFFNILFVILLPFKLSSTRQSFDVSQGSSLVYRGQSQSRAGDRIYLGMELVTGENQKKWNIFLRHTRTFTWQDGDYCRATQYLKPEKRDPEDQSFQTFKEDTGFDDTQLEDFLNNLSKKGSGHNEIVNMQCVMDGICDNARGSGSPLNTDGNQYIVYASTKNIEGPCKLPDYTPCHPNRNLRRAGLTLRQYNEIYDDILMVSIFHNDPGSPVIENTGIFRMPKRLLDGSYKGISMPLFGFAADMFQIMNMDKKSMVIHANYIMNDILRHQLGTKAIHVGTNDSRDNQSQVAPPRIHVHKQDDFTIMVRILKEGQDARSYQDGVPPEDKVEYEIGNIRKCQGSMSNPRKPILIKIEALRKHYKSPTIFANPTASEELSYIDVEVLCQR